MNFQEFKTDALRTESRPEKLNFSLGGTGALLAACAAMGAVADLAKKTIFYGKPLDKEDFGLAIHDTLTLLIMIEDNIDSLANPDYKPSGQAAEKYPLYVPNLRLVHGALGMFTEAAELAEALTVQISGQGSVPGVLDTVNFIEEIGDSDWYKAILHDELGISEDSVREKVVAKLQKRYGDKFSSEAALNRDLAGERKALEADTAADQTL